MHDSTPRFHCVSWLCMLICICTYFYVCTVHAHIYMFIYVYMSTQTYIYIYAHICTCCICKYVLYIYVCHIHMSYTYVCTQVSQRYLAHMTCMCPPPHICIYLHAGFTTLFGSVTCMCPPPHIYICLYAGFTASFGPACSCPVASRSRPVFTHTVSLTTRKARKCPSRSEMSWTHTNRLYLLKKQNSSARDFI